MLNKACSCIMAAVLMALVCGSPLVSMAQDSQAGREGVDVARQLDDYIVTLGAFLVSLRRQLQSMSDQIASGDARSIVVEHYQDLKFQEAQLVANREKADKLRTKLRDARRN